MDHCADFIRFECDSCQPLRGSGLGPLCRSIRFDCDMSLSPGLAPKRGMTQGVGRLFWRDIWVASSPPKPTVDCEKYCPLLIYARMSDAPNPS